MANYNTNVEYRMMKFCSPSLLVLQCCHVIDPMAKPVTTQAVQ